MISSHAPGSRIIARDEEWLVRQVDLPPSGAHLLSATGSSLLVRNRETTFTSEVLESYQTMVMNHSTANTDEAEANLPGMFGGVLTFSCEFNFRPDGGELIRGPLAETVTEATASLGSQQFKHKRVMRTLKISSVITRTGKKKSAYELLDLKPLTTAPLAPRGQK